MPKRVTESNRGADGPYSYFEGLELMNYPSVIVFDLPYQADSQPMSGCLEATEYDDVSDLSEDDSQELSVAWATTFSLYSGIGREQDGMKCLHPSMVPDGFNNQKKFKQNISLSKCRNMSDIASGYKKDEAPRIPGRTHPHCPLTSPLRRIGSCTQENMNATWDSPSLEDTANSAHMPTQLLNPFSKQKKSCLEVFLEGNVPLRPREDTPPQLPTRKELRLKPVCATDHKCNDRTKAENRHEIIRGEDGVPTHQFLSTTPTSRRTEMRRPNEELLNSNIQSCLRWKGKPSQCPSRNDLCHEVMSTAVLA